jgi:hypothetical protein
VHGQTRIRPRAVVWGLVVAACLFAAIAGTGVAAQKPNAQPLWNAYPLDEDQGASGGGAQNASTTTTTSTQPASSAASTTTQPSVTVEQAGDGPPWVLMIAAAGGGALFVVVLLTLQGRRDRRREEALVGATDEWPWLNGSARRDGHEVRVERVAQVRNGVTAERSANGTAPERVDEPAANGAASERVAERQPDVDRERVADSTFDVTEAVDVPRHRFDRDAANGPPVVGRRGPICQVRWSAAATCFYAITTDVDGVEHRLAWSPPIEWGEDPPPDEDSREARAAMRVLAKELRDKGWKPMRAKGEDFGEPRWYARRFRFPIVEGDDEATPWLHGPPAAAARGDD